MRFEAYARKVGVSGCPCPFLASQWRLQKLLDCVLAEALSGPRDF